VTRVPKVPLYVQRQSLPSIGKNLWRKTMRSGLARKVALVTGGSQGIGRATVLAIAAEGCDVVIAARTHDKVLAVAEEARAHDVAALPITADVMNTGAVTSLIDAAYDWHGRLDFLVTCAGTRVAA